MQVELDVPEVKEVICNPKRTALVIVDLENESCAPGGRKFTQEAAECAITTANLANRVRSVGGRVIWIRSVRDRDALEFTHYGRDYQLIRDTWATEFTPPLEVLEGEAVIEKTSHDCFNQTGMDTYLKKAGIVPPDWSIIVAGVSLNVCVNHAVLGFSVRDYPVFVPLDCVAFREHTAVPTLWHYGLQSYSYNIAVTKSSLISWSHSEKIPESYA